MSLLLRKHKNGNTSTDAVGYIGLGIFTVLFIAYLFILFQVVSDLFRDHEASGLYKAAWIVFLLFIPLLTSLIYLIVRGKGMAERHRAQVKKSVSATNEYIREVAGKSPAEQISDAKKLLDDGIITEEEYQKLKAKALS